MRTVKGLRRQIFFILTVGISTSFARDAKDIYDLTLGELASLRIFSGAALTKTEAGKVPCSGPLRKENLQSEEDPAHSPCDFVRFSHTFRWCSSRYVAHNLERSGNPRYLRSIVGVPKAEAPIEDPVKTCGLCPVSP